MRVDAFKAQLRRLCTEGGGAGDDDGAVATKCERIYYALVIRKLVLLHRNKQELDFAYA